MATMKRCLAQLSIRVAGQEEHFWPGLEVNFDRELSPGYTVAQAVEGRESCFEDATAPVMLEAEERVLTAGDLHLLSAATEPREEHE